MAQAAVGPIAWPGRPWAVRTALTPLEVNALGPPKQAIALDDFVVNLLLGGNINTRLARYRIEAHFNLNAPPSQARADAPPSPLSPGAVHHPGEGRAREQLGHPLRQAPPPHHHVRSTWAEDVTAAHSPSPSLRTPASTPSCSRNSAPLVAPAAVCSAARAWIVVCARRSHTSPPLSHHSAVSSLPYWPMPSTTPLYASKDEVAAYQRAYAQFLNVRSNTTVCATG